MNSIRRHLTAIGITWLVFEAGVLAVSPFVSCCAAGSQTAALDDDECCQGLAPGQICPLHKHRQHAPPKDTHQGGPQDTCAIRGDCGHLDPALVSIGFGLGVLEPPVSLILTLVSTSVPQSAARALECARSLDPPPPR